MIHRDFREPNFRCTVTDKNGTHHTWLTHATSKSELNQRLVDLKFKEIKIKPYDFKKWKKRAAAARRRAIEAHKKGDKISFNSNLWRELKLLLFELFDGKCAYCEIEVQLVAPGDVEHYRPKGGVAKHDEHPGYYWLAYEPDNLLPSCPNCNVVAKGTQFPIGGTRANDPDDSLDDEKPLLLNPYKTSHPEKHLKFTASPIIGPLKLKPLGTVVGRTAQGKATVEVCNLDRLDTARAKAQEDFMKDLTLRANLWNSAEIASLWREVYTGRREFSAAIIAQRKEMEKCLPCLSREEVLGVSEGKT